MKNEYESLKEMINECNNIVVFTGAGIYRYTITESLAEGFEYDNTGVTETKISGSETPGSHVRYVDVYVKPTDRKNGETPVFQNGLTAELSFI